MGGEHFVRFDNRQFVGETLTVDSRWFENCRFERVTMIYAGGPFRFVNCVFGPGCQTLIQPGVEWPILFVLEAQRSGFDFGVSFEPPGPTN